VRGRLATDARQPRPCGGLRTNFRLAFGYNRAWFWYPRNPPEATRLRSVRNPSMEPWLVITETLDAEAEQLPVLQSSIWPFPWL